ncbi:ornithine cyclodeaminase family protein [Streptomyces sp. SID13031]|uniref:ornithine cyclodeaminase family protein n=1 Tax=Streptomyces sp. SID13031 TaxID=2706046 RepID=UPI0013C90AC2|nr:ornithine cyclodeaminase family protein [Streptomyces sp. SID13031]NEA33268.1 ornithine cyclodeaminase family protein [Streptomyces sp. SID13031]
MSLPVIGLPEIAAIATPEVIFGAVKEALIAHAEGRTSVPPPMVLEFPDHAGDCHVKAGHVGGSAHFAVKIASTFASVNNGLILVIDATAGVPAAVLADEGMLTAWRTAAAGALITHAMTPPGIDEVAVLGTGEQALLQVTWLRKLRPINRIRVWGRRPEAAERLCQAFENEGLEARADALEGGGAPCVITTTAARSPLPTEAFRNALHVTGIGTDMPGKHELPVELFADALVVTDDHDQCLHHGDFGNAVRAGIIRPNADHAVGAVLRDGPAVLRDGRPARGTRSPVRSTRSIADLTGVGATDAAVASAVVGNRFSTLVE